jgi:phosphoesterase RecJ-like protein
VITSHVNPDGDAIGASLGLYHFLLRMGYSVSVVIPNDFPRFLEWMPGSKKILITNRSFERSVQLINTAEVIFCLDFNAIERLEALSDTVRNSKAMRILIDHHVDPVHEFDEIISVVSTSSTSELVYDFIDSFGEDHRITKNIAECIYAGIMTDTGSFSYSCNNEKTYQVVASLMRKGIDAEQIHRLVYDTYSENRMRLLGYSISDKLVVLHEYHTAYISLTRQELKRFKYKIGDTEGIVNYALSIKGINLAVLLTERERLIRLSLRSKGTFSVNDLARMHFDGGGHRNAAGGNSYVTMDETLEKLVSLLKLYQNELNYE